MSLIFRSPAYLAWIRRQPCVLCGGHGSEAAHQTLGMAGRGIKAPDTLTIPLCPSCHAESHRKGKFWLDQIIDVRVTIIKLLTQYLKERQDGEA